MKLFTTFEGFIKMIKYSFRLQKEVKIEITGNMNLSMFDVITFDVCLIFLRNNLEPIYIEDMYFPYHFIQKYQI